MRIKGPMKRRGITRTFTKLHRRLRMLPSRFGSNHTAVEAFLRSLDAIPWFTQVSQSTDQDECLVRVGFDFLADCHEDPYAPWGKSLVEAEANIERLIFGHRRLGEYSEVQRAIGQRGPNLYMDEFFTGLVDKYPGYYGKTSCYAHELVEMPDRILWGAAHEIVLADVEPNLNFFQSIMPWFRAGHWPCGWKGQWPEGKLIVW
jgi:hypothetical protein